MSQQIRDYISRWVASIPVPQQAIKSQDGATVRRWVVRGGETQGLVATISDCDDVVEFGLLQRSGHDSSSNVMHVTLVIDDDVVLLNAMSEWVPDLNFDQSISLEALGKLPVATRLFEEYVGVRAS